MSSDDSDTEVTGEVAAPCSARGSDSAEQCSAPAARRRRRRLPRSESTPPRRRRRRQAGESPRPQEADAPESPRESRPSNLNSWRRRRRAKTAAVALDSDRLGAVALGSVGTVVPSDPELQVAPFPPSVNEEMRDDDTSQEPLLDESSQLAEEAKKKKKKPKKAGCRKPHPTRSYYDKGGLPAAGVERRRTLQRIYSQNRKHRAEIRERALARGEVSPEVQSNLRAEINGLPEGASAQDVLADCQDRVLRELRRVAWDKLPRHSHAGLGMIPSYIREDPELWERFVFLAVLEHRLSELCVGTNSSPEEEEEEMEEEE
ncbi:unnamed protein product [Symbiodinium sp. CCMP2592]|nr:unnamed protein product [Symbiodinium sp. CCMP2592]